MFATDQFNSTFRHRHADAAAALEAEETLSKGGERRRRRRQEVKADRHGNEVWKGNGR